ncbi:CueP family metal-binding protein [Georgenia sp. TF02-10]|uniref:CueP family metal-binding protein n=1 Tax=Georgenia sp. TF02-10 TaxID=2917725 RepID=UPI001FA6AB2E|nr:CueP family metal-binding protein [Georgenia sp. TF02-10]UNX55694.1 CueP family metal-binding protein [Georgenia sp. TF02-10]
MRRLPTAAAAAALTMILAGCSSAEPGAGQAPAGPGAEPPAAEADAELLAEHDLAGMEAPEIIERLDRLAVDERPSDLMASVRPDELLLSDGEQDLALEIPGDRHYLSIAPYVNQTHECFYHSLTTCTGELSGEEVQVRIVDDATGEVLVEEQATTFDNGFVGLWLPREVEGTIEVSHDGLTGVTDFSTTDEGATCVTTLQLA